MEFKELLTKNPRIYFDNKDDLKEFLDLCANENIKWSSGRLANEDFNFSSNIFDKYGGFIYIVSDSIRNFSLTHSNNSSNNSSNYSDFKSQLTNNFKDLFNKYSVHCDTKDKAIKFLQLCEDNNIEWCSGDKPLKWEKFYIDGSNTVYGIDKGLNKLLLDANTTSTITYEEFIDLLGNKNITIKEDVNNDILKDLINKYLIRNNDFNINSEDLIDFITECNDRFKLNII